MTTLIIRKVCSPDRYVIEVGPHPDHPESVVQVIERDGEESNRFTVDASLAAEIGEAMIACSKEVLR
jgi:hypothetical protein